MNNINLVNCILIADKLGKIEDEIKAIMIEEFGNSVDQKDYAVFNDLVDVRDNIFISSQKLRKIPMGRVKAPL